MLPEDEKALVESDAAQGIIRLIRPEGAQLTIRQFGVDGVDYETLKPINGRNYMRVKWRAKNESVLVSLLEARCTPEDAGELDEVTAAHNESETGFDAITRDGKKISFRVPLRIGGSYEEPAAEEAALAVQEENKLWSGLAIGRDTVTLGSKKVILDSSDCEFVFSKSSKKPQLSAVLRPINPPQFLPGSDVFVDKLEITIVSKTSDVDIYYTIDGSEPTLTSRRYTEPFAISASCMVQARAFRCQGDRIPFSTAGTTVSDISFAQFRKEPMLRASKSREMKPGLLYDYMEGRWMRLFGSADRLPAKSSGSVENLLDVSMRQSDGPFAVRYSGYLEVPANGVYTFYAPKEYAHNGCEPGYDLRVSVDGKEWRPGQMWHALGLWSVPLEKGAHRFQVVYADARAKDIEKQRVDYWWGYPTPWVVWRGTAPVLEISAPELERQPVPAAWLKH
jgi:hypothetical protein